MEQKINKIKMEHFYEVLHFGKSLAAVSSGGEGGIRTHVPRLRDNSISSRARYGQLRYLSAGQGIAPRPEGCL